MAKKQISITAAEVAAPPEIRELVEKFAEHRESYRRGLQRGELIPPLQG